MNALVAVGSRHGATLEIGRAIAATLDDEGVEVTSVPAEQVTSVAEFDAVVIGSAVYAGRWVEPAKRLVECHAAELAEKPVWLFSSGPLGDPLKPEGDPADVAPIVERIRPREHRVFGGALERSSLGLVERGIVGMVKAPYGDFRDWSAVADWARGIAASLRVAT